MENKNKRLIAYSLIGSLLLVFGFYSSTMNYASALTASSFTVNTFDLRGSTYNQTNNAWYFASPNNNTMIRLPNNTTSPISMPVNGNSNCADPIDILSLKFASEQFIALWCDNGAVATHGLMIRDSLTNLERDFESNIFNTEDSFIMVESETLDKMYVVNHGAGSSPQIAIFNLQAINSTSQAMFIGSIGFNGQCGTVYSAVINDDENEMYVTCSRVTTTTNTLVVVDLEVSSAVTFITLTGTAGTLTVDFNSATNRIAVVDYTANDLWIVNRDTSTIVYTNTSICASGGGLSPQFNENVNQLYIICNVSGTGVNTILLFDVPTNSTVTSFTAGSSPVGVQGGTHYWAQQHFEESIGRLYATFGFTQNTGSGAVSNTITTIFDDSDLPDEVQSEFCLQPENFNILRCVLERGDTTPLMGASETIDESATNIICQIGLVQCVQNADGSFTPVDDNIQTNGIGYIILVVALGILIGIFWVASRGDLGSIPTFLWFIASLAVIGTITAFEFIDPTFLIIAIIAIIALAVAKAKGLFGSSALFTGET
jgi:hypothetical protein